MNYVNYEIAIKYKHHVELIGWPTSIPFANPSKIGTVGPLKNLRDALKVGTCIWKQMSVANNAKLKLKVASMQESGKTIGTGRRQQSDAGVKCKSKASKNVSTDVEDSDDDDNSASKCPSKRAKPTTTKRTKTTSKGKGKALSKVLTSTQKKRTIAKQLPPVLKSKEFIGDSSSAEESDDDDSAAAGAADEDEDGDGDGSDDNEEDELDEHDG